MNLQRPIVENLEIKGGLGPIQANDMPISIELAPLTVFIGPQGSGKSLISQLLYFFHDAHYLISRYFRQESPDATVREVVDNLRSGKRALASFLTTNIVRLNHQLTIDQNKVNRHLGLYQSNRKISPLHPFNKEVEKWIETLLNNPTEFANIRSQALFVPAERTFYSRFINSNVAILGSEDLPITMREFTQFLSKANGIHRKWADEDIKKPLQVTQIDEFVYEALGGHATVSKKDRYSRQWQWIPKKGQQPFEIEMASSGQMGAWPLVSSMQALYGISEQKRPRFIHIEEPETHLHPSAQVAMMKMIAFLINEGFRIIITTHSLEVLYTLNVLTAAYQHLNDTDSPNFPPHSQRLAAENITAYLFHENKIKKVIDDSGQIDDGLLGYVLGSLEVHYGQIIAQ